MERFSFWIALVVLNQSAKCFLLEGSTNQPPSNSQFLAYRHYDHLLESLFEEKQARQQLEQIVSQLKVKVDQLAIGKGHNPVNISEILDPYVKQIQRQEIEIGNFKSAMTTLMKEKADLRNRVISLEQNYTILLDDLHISDHIKQTMQQEIDMLKQMKNMDAGTALQKTTQDVHELKVNEQARRQDFLALYNLTLSSQHRIDLLHQQSVTDNKTISNRIKTLNDNIEQQIKEFYHNLTQKAAITACDAYTRPGHAIAFTATTVSTGLTLTNHTEFIAEKPGFYFITTNILSSSNAGYSIKLNGNGVARTWPKYGTDDLGYFTASTSALVQMNVGDKIGIFDYYTSDPVSVDVASCLTIVKL